VAGKLEKSTERTRSRKRYTKGKVDFDEGCLKYSATQKGGRGSRRPDSLRRLQKAARKKTVFKQGLRQFF